MLASDPARQDFPEIVMLKTLLAATTALTLMSGVGFAQSSYSNTTTETTKMVPTPPTHDVDVTTSTRRTETRNGVMIEKDVTGDEVSRPGSVDSTQTRTRTESTTVR
jgi:hypothetical protein